MNGLELFTGGGGLALGTERAGFPHLALVERDSDSCLTLRHNRSNWPVFEEDVHTFDYRSAAATPDDLPDAEIVARLRALNLAPEAV